MLRLVYDLLWYLALPLLPLRLWWRGRREPGYRAQIGERYGRYAFAPRTPGPWLGPHAIAASSEPLICSCRSITAA